MRFDYPVLVLINTNVINGHKKQVDSVRLILCKVVPHCSLEMLVSCRGLGNRVGSPPCPLLLPWVLPSDAPTLPDR